MILLLFVLKNVAQPKMFATSRISAVILASRVFRLIRISAEISV